MLLHKTSGKNEVRPWMGARTRLGWSVISMHKRDTQENTVRRWWIIWDSSRMRGMQVPRRTEKTAEGFGEPMERQMASTSVKVCNTSQNNI